MENINDSNLMAFKLTMLREIYNLTEEELAKKLNVDEKTILDWENCDKEIDINNAKKICEFFNISKSYFVFNEDFDKLDYSLQEKINDYVEECILEENVDKIINNCKKKLNNDQIALKDEYLPIFDYDNEIFDSYGLFDDNISKLLSNDSLIDNLNNYNYSTENLAHYNLTDVLFKYKKGYIELSQLVNCDNLTLFKETLESTKSKKYTEQNMYNPFVKIDVTERHIQDELNKTLENLNPNLTNFWQIIVFLIDNGAYYTKQVGAGSDVVCWSEIEDTSRTNLVYRIAKDKCSE